jgi:transposase InsO family protein
MEKQYPDFVTRVFRSDNAREILMSNTMQLWMRQNGIVDEESPPYTPQHNGKAERLMRTILEPVRSILAMSQLPYSCWPELVQAVVYIKNRLPSQAIGGRVPFEVLTGRKANISHLRILGCVMLMLCTRLLEDTSWSQKPITMSLLDMVLPLELTDYSIQTGEQYWSPEMLFSMRKALSESIICLTMTILG